MSVYDIRKPCLGDLCYEDKWLSKLLNDPAVQEVLGVDDRKWESINYQVFFDLGGKPWSAASTKGQPHDGCCGVAQVCRTPAIGTWLVLWPWHVVACHGAVSLVCDTSMLGRVAEVP